MGGAAGNLLERATVSSTTDTRGHGSVRYRAVHELTALVQPPAVLGSVRRPPTGHRASGPQSLQRERAGYRDGCDGVRGRPVAELAVQVLPPAVRGPIRQERAGVSGTRDEAGRHARQTDDRGRA